MGRQLHRQRALTIAVFAFAAITLIALGVNRAAVSPPDQTPKPPASSAEPVALRRVGNDSCVARGCHGAVGTVDATSGNYYTKGGEATTWRTFDPHARAYKVLLDPRSVRMGKLLAGRLDHQPPERAKLCLDCHSVGGAPGPDRPAAEFTTGVDCETCHGPASTWVEPHLSASFAGLKDSEKAKLGLRSLKSLSDRAGLCVTCHVGDATKQVDHDLIAAGHPRLAFEFDSYLDALPRHWQEDHEKPGAKSSGDFHARAWAIGQVAAADSALGLLKHRAEEGVKGTSPWPELAEFDCFSCHHQLAPSSWRQDLKDGREPGAPAWGGWTMSGLLSLAKGKPGDDLRRIDSSITGLRAAMGRTTPDPARVAGLADEARKSLIPWREIPEGLQFNAIGAETLLRDLLDPKNPPKGWDEAGARSLSAASLARTVETLTGRPIDAGLARDLKALQSSLRFSDRLDSPKGYAPPGR